MSRRSQAELALAGVTLIWGASFVVVKGALGEIPLATFLALRFAIAALVLGAVYFRKVQRRGWAPGLAAGAILFVAFVLQTAGLALTTPSKSAFLTGLSIPMVPLLSGIVYKNRPRWYEVAGILIASTGMALMTLPSGRFQISSGDILTLLCAVAFALHITVIGHFSARVGFESLAVVQVTVAAALGAGMALASGSAGFRPSPAAIVSVAMVGLLATALAFTTMAWVQQHTSSSRAALILSLEPVAAWITAWLVAGETMPARGKMGAGLILAGILLVELKRSMREEHHIQRVPVPETGPHSAQRSQKIQ